MSDLGNDKYLDILTKETLYCLYTDAMDCICKMQNQVDTSGLDKFDKSEQMNEMSLFDEWYIGKHLEVNLSKNSQRNFINAMSIYILLYLKYQKKFYT